MPAKKPRYVAAVGLNFPHPRRQGEEVRVEPGEEVRGLTDDQARALLAQDPPAIRVAE